MSKPISRTAYAVQLFAGYIGHQLLSVWWYLIDLIVFSSQAMRDSRKRARSFNRAHSMNIYRQIIFTGIDAIPTMTLLGIGIGFSMTAQLILIVQTFGTEKDVMDVLTRLVVLELGSLLTAIVLIGRSGSAITVDLGNMKVNKEIESLELLGINVNDFFVGPRLVGTAASQLALAVYFSVIAIVSGVLLLSLIYSSSYLSYLIELPLAFDPFDLLGFVIKNVFFGLIIAATACYHGLQVNDSPTEVPQQTQRAIVSSLILIVVADGILVFLSV